MQRVREKKSVLSDKTDDETIIDNAVSTALNQEDLAALIQMEYKTIYLCGELFNVPIRVPNMKYIGILGTPKIKIRAKSQEEVDAKQISFENVQLPWQKAAPIEELKALAEKIFQTGGKFPIVNYSKKKFKNLSFDQLDKTEKSAALRMVCQGKYAEHQIAFMQLTEDLSSGFAFTTDAFCTGGSIGSNLIPYKKINVVKGIFRLEITLSNEKFIRLHNGELFNNSDYGKIVRFLEVAKNF